MKIHQVETSNQNAKTIDREFKNVERYKRKVRAEQPVRYTVLESYNLFDLENRDILPKRSNSRRFIIIDDQVEKLYGDRISEYFDYYKVECRILPLQISEQTKTIDTVLQVVKELDEFGLLRRNEPIIGIGGGVLLDIVGLVASLYRRGVPYIRVPTTLIALIDAGIGVKTGVNFQKHKNRIGTYHAPLITFIDKNFVKTLDNRHVCNGLAEILKIGIIKDRELFELLEIHGTQLITKKFQNIDVADVVIRRAIQGMLDELEPNLWEHQLYRLMDFGHSFSPMLEMNAIPKLLHGEAVALDMSFSTVLAAERSLLSVKDRDRILDLTRLLGLPTAHQLCIPSLLSESLQEIVKHRDGLQRIPLPTSIGRSGFFDDLTSLEIEATSHKLQQLQENR
jgi:2-epi-5-epi-valiolone synthase